MSDNIIEKIDALFAEEEADKEFSEGLVPISADEWDRVHLHIDNLTADLARVTAERDALERRHIERDILDEQDANATANLIKERDSALAEVERRYGIGVELIAARRERDEAVAERDALRVDAEAKQAKIDALMLEYCPDEMTPEQVKTWAEHQIVGGSVADVLAAARGRE